jgi:hypothetical protein
MDKNVKKGQGAAGLLGRVGAGGVGGGGGLSKPAPKGKRSGPVVGGEGRPSPTTPTGGPAANNPAERGGKPEQRRPTGRAISGG